MIEHAVSTNVWNSEGAAITSCIALVPDAIVTECGCLKIFYNYKINLLISFNKNN